MGLFSQKQTTKTTLPSWLSSGLQAGFGQVADLAGRDPYSFVADWNPFQDAAAGRAAQLGASNPYLDHGVGIINNALNKRTPTVGAASLLEGLDKYFNPATGSFVDASLRGYDRDAGKTLAQQELDLAGNPFSGSGAALALGETKANTSLNRAQLEAGLRKDAWDSATGLSSQDAGRRQEASIANAQLEAQAIDRAIAAGGLFGELGFRWADNNRADVGTLMDVGNSKYAVDSTTRGAPLTVAGTTMGLMNSFPSQLFAKTTTKTNPGLGSVLGGLGSLALGVGAMGGLGGLGSLGGLFGGGAGAANTAMRNMAGWQGWS